MRIVFMGTPDFAAVILREIALWAKEDPGRELVAVYARPDRPAGRGNKRREPATKVLAKELGLPVYQPVSFKADEEVRALRDLAPDVLVVAAYGLILPQRVLDIPTLGPYNVHASLLPKHRGAAPIQRAVLSGDKVSGVTIMRMEAGLDTGPILLQQAVSIEPGDTSGSMFELLAEHGAKLMIGALGMIGEGRAAFLPQNEEAATYAPKITADEEYIDWSRTADEVHNQIRGLFPLPGGKAGLHVPGKEPLPLRLEPGEPVPAEDASGPVSGCFLPENAKGTVEPGTVLGFENNALIVACGRGTYRLTRLRPAGKGSMSAADFRNGRLRGVAAPYGVLRKS